MSNRQRTPSPRGIESRPDADGVERHRGTAHDRRTGRRLKGPWTRNLAEARAWRVDALARLQAGVLSGDRGPTIRAATEEFLAGIADGSICNRSGGAYKPSAVRGYERDLRERIVKAFGATRLNELRLPDVQRFADRLAADGLAPSTVRNVVNALRAMYAWAMPRGLATINPTRGLRLPTGGAARDRIATAAEAALLVAALAPEDQAALGLALYAGLRLGELLALDWSAVDLEARTLRVERSWDHGSLRFVAPKSRAGRRTVPIVERLAVLLADHRVLKNHPTAGLLFPADDPTRPISHNALRDRTSAAWKKAKLAPIGFHEGRHTFASLAIDAGVNAKALSTYLGHASIAITLDRYGHLMPGNEAEAAGLLDVYLAGDDE